MTLIPVLASLTLKVGSRQKQSRFTHPADLVRRIYRPQLAWALDHPKTVVVVALALLAFAILLASQGR